MPMPFHAEVDTVFLGKLTHWTEYCQPLLLLVVVLRPGLCSHVLLQLSLQPASADPVKFLVLPPRERLWCGAALCKLTGLKRKIMEEKL